MRARATDAWPLFHRSVRPINCEHPRMRRTNAEAREGTVRIVRWKSDLEYFAHEVQRSVDCRSVYKEPVQRPEREELTQV